MMKEQKIITTKTTAICDLIDHYVQHTGVNLWDFHVTCGFMNLMEIAQEACPEDTLDQASTTRSSYRYSPLTITTVGHHDGFCDQGCSATGHHRYLPRPDA